MRLFITLLLGLASFCIQAEIKSTELDLFDSSRDRPVKIRVWYQADNNCAAKLCVATSPDQTQTPVALISHGAFGSPREMNWLGYGLAQQSWLVIGVAHYGESWVYGRESVDYSSVGKKWLRAQDISFVVDELMAGNLTDKKINTTNITMLGHSLGGYSALSLVGADYNLDAMIEYCKSAIATDMGCRYGKQQGAPKPLTKTQLPKISVLDKRISAVVSLDPALGPSVSKEALTNISVPTLIVGSVNNDFLNFSSHAGYYASSIPGAKLISLSAGEGHFVYIDECEHPHKAMGVSLCEDREGIDRAKVHQGLLSEISRFMNQL